MGNGHDAIFARFTRATIFLPRHKPDQKDFIASACLKNDVSFKRFLDYSRRQNSPEFEAELKMKRDGIVEEAKFTEYTNLM